MKRLLWNRWTVLVGLLFAGHGAVNGASLTTINGTVSNAAGPFTLGVSDANNVLIVTNAGSLIATSGTIGSTAPADFNFATVTGSGSIWTNSGSLVVGSSGAGNRLTISDQGVVANSSAVIGSASGANNNSVWVDGSGSVWTNTGRMDLGGTGIANLLVITNGGKVFSAGAILGNSSAGAVNNNTGIVTGIGSVWNAGGFTNGYGGTGNRVVVSAGGNLLTTFTLSGQYGGNNAMLITDPGSAWTNTGALYWGNQTPGNVLTISNAARFVSSSSYIGWNYYDTANNKIEVTGDGSVWEAGSLSVGGKGYGNLVSITSSGRVVSTSASFGSTPGGGAGNNNSVQVSGPGSLWTNSGSIAFGVAANAPGNFMVISNGGRVVAGGNGVLGAASGSSNSFVTITGAGSSWTMAALTNGDYANGNTISVSDGAALNTAGAVIGAKNAIANNQIVVSGSNSVWTSSSGITVGEFGNNNRLIITNGGYVSSSSGTIGNSSGSTSYGSYNAVLVGGAGSIWTNTGNLLVNGGRGYFSSLTITNGGKVYSGAATVGVGAGGEVYGGYNTGLVTGAGSSWSINGGITIGSWGPSNQFTISDNGVVEGDALLVGDRSDGNRLVVSAGGQLVTTSAQARGIFVGNNTMLVTDPGSVWRNSGALNWGTDTGGNVLTISNGALLEANSLLAGAGAGNVISNWGGVYQFTAGTPTITPNGAGKISITDGTVSFRGVGAATATALSGLTYAGENTLRLNASSNATGLASYNFNTGLGGANYVRLEMLNDTTLWRSGTLAIGSGGSMLVSNTTATVAAVVSSTGLISVVNSKMTFLSNVVIAGSYVSDPSTNTFLNDLTVTLTGTLAGGPGDLFDFKKNMIIQSTNNQAFQLHSSAVQFSGGGMHTNEITGLDLGNGPSAYDAAFTLGTNFAYGELHLGSASDEICFACQNVAPSNALYVGWLDLLGATNYVANLHASNNITIYYATDDTRNSYLGNQTFQLTQCDGVTLGGLLMPVIPEPSSLLLAGMALVGGLWMRRRRQV